MPPLLIIFFNIKKYFLMFCPVFVPHYLLLLFSFRPSAEKHIYYFYFSKFFSADMHPLWFFCPIVSLDDSFFLFLLFSCTASHVRVSCYPSTCSLAMLCPCLPWVCLSWGIHGRGWLTSGGIKKYRGCCFKWGYLLTGDILRPVNTLRQYPVADRLIYLCVACNLLLFRK